MSRQNAYTHTSMHTQRDTHRQTHTQSIVLIHKPISRANDPALHSLCC